MLLKTVLTRMTLIPRFMKRPIHILEIAFPRMDTTMAMGLIPEIRNLSIHAWSSRGSSAAEPFTTASILISPIVYRIGTNSHFCELSVLIAGRLSEGSAFDVDSLDEEFLWNSYMIDPLIKFRSRLAVHEKGTLDASHMLTSAIRGFVSTILIPPSSSPVQATRTNLPSGLTLISRLSCRRAGTRFNARGIDDDGYVANSVETETTFYQPSGLCFSYAQIRGSVPLFWEQAPGLLPGQQKIQITRSPEATQPAFDKHFEQLSLNYGTVHILNLLSETKPGEVELSARYKSHVAHSPLNQILDLEEASDHRELQMSHFDFHAETKGPGGYEAASLVRRLIQDRAEAFAYFLSDEAGLSGSETVSTEKASQILPTVVLQQEGVFRTNCLDCLDRTNLIQTIISQMAFESCLNHRSERASADFWMRHSSLWADNGDVRSNSSLCLSGLLSN